MSIETVSNAELVKWCEVVPAAEAHAIAKARQVAQLPVTMRRARLRWERSPGIVVTASGCAEWLVMDGRASAAAGSAVIECAPLARLYTAPSPQNTAAVVEAFTVAYLGYLTDHGAPAALLGLAEPEPHQGDHAVA